MQHQVLSVDSNSTWQPHKRWVLGEGVVGFWTAGAAEGGTKHHSLISVQTFVRFWQKKRPSYPPHSPHAIPLMQGHLWAHGPTLPGSLCITILPYSIAKQTVCDGSEGDFSSPFFLGKKIKALGPLITDEHAFIAFLTFKASHFLILRLIVDK